MTAEKIGQFWSTFGQLLVPSPYCCSSVVIKHHVNRIREPLAPCYLDLVVIEKRQLRQCVLRLSIEVRVHCKQLFRRDLRQVPRFKFALNPAEYIPKKLDLLARREVDLIIQRLELHRLEIVDLLFQIPVPVDQGRLTDPDLSSDLCQREPIAPQLHKTLFCLLVFHTSTYARMTI